jgi:hypothetical protein
MRYYDTLLETDRGGFNVIVDKTNEEIDPADCFDDAVSDIAQIREDINSGRLDWFMLRVRVFFEDLELASSYLGGMLYEDPTECLTDGSAEDMIAEALAEARARIPKLTEGLLKLELDNIKV